MHMGLEGDVALSHSCLQVKHSYGLAMEALHLLWVAVEELTDIKLP